VSSVTWPTVIGQLIDNTDLPAQYTDWAMDQIMSDAATPAQLAGFAVALRAKGETAAEISGMADAMLRHAHTVEMPTRAVDIVGTGGDRSGSVNISTMSALVTAGAGAPVVKHGNRAVSSKAGAADVLEALGIGLELSPADVRRCLDEVGIGFCLAPRFHPALRFAGPTRAELGVPTTFNLLGPLTNPAQPRAGMIGCAYREKTATFAEVFARRGDSTLVVRGDDGLDEITTTTTSSAWVVTDGTVREETIEPDDLGIARATAAELRGGTAADNATVAGELLAGKPGPVRDAVLLNAGGAIAAHTGFGDDLTTDLRSGISRAAAAIDSGAAARLLAAWSELSQRLGA